MYRTAIADRLLRRAPSNALRMRPILFLLVVTTAGLISAGCSTLPSGRGWGADATVQPGWARVRQAASDAAKDPWVWAPAVGALAFQVNSFDRKTSDWARENTPIYGSTGNAERWSDNLRATCGFAMVGTLIAAPSGPDASEWLLNKLKGGAVELAAVGATSATTAFLKNTTGRTRPNGSDDESFLSGHTSSAAVYCELAKINLDAIDTSDAVRRATGIGLDVAVIGTAWARVEAGEHFPSDVLAAMALGNFFARFVTDAFLEPDTNRSLSLTPVAGGAELSWNIRF
jgi:membrane-associated phospholipid phosphatase